MYSFLNPSNINMDPMLNKVLKGAAVGAGVGIFLWAGKQIVPSRPQTKFEEVNNIANELLSADRNIKSLCERLRQYQYMDYGSYTTILMRCAELIDLQMQLQRREIKPSLSIPRIVSRKCSDIVESIRRIRAFTLKQVNNNQQTLMDFDEIAGEFQRICNDYSYNLTKIVECQRQ